MFMGQFEENRMCGIAVFFGKTALPKERFVSALKEMDHRGPDSLGLWQNGAGTVSLGHARLSIIDLVTGSQPIGTAEHDLQLVANGEFYDFEQIRKTLEDDGAVFKTKSDSEIALHLYRRLGPSALKQLRGEFAFAIWDERNQQLFAARDRFGIKPLYYAQKDGNLFVASEIKVILKMGFAANWDLESISQVSTGWSLSPTRTAFKGVYQVPPGHFLIATAGEIKIIPYWDFDYPLPDAPQPSEQEAIEIVRSKFEEAVRLRLRADVPVGCYLSGGIDSCAVLGVASKFSPSRIHAFTIQFENPDYDESAIAKRMAESANAHFNPVIVTPRDLADHFAKAVWHAETLFVNTHGIAKYLLSRFVRNSGIKVVLTGEGSDEIFAGYPHFRQDMIRYSQAGGEANAIAESLLKLQTANKVSIGLAMSAGEMPGLAEVTRLLGFSPAHLETNLQAGQATRGLLSEEFKALYPDRDPILTLLRQFDLQRQIRGRDPVHQSMYLWSKTTLPNYILSVLGDRMEMAHSIEGRVPFLDHHLVEAVVKMPVGLKIKGSTEKYVLREATKSVLTEEVYGRQKHPFLAPPAATNLNGPLYELMRDKLSGPALEHAPFYNKKAVLGFLDQLPKMDPMTRSKVDPILTSILSIVILGERYSIGSN